MKKTLCQSYNSFNGKNYVGSEGLKAGDLPVSIPKGVTIQALPPSVSEFEALYTSLGQYYDEIVAILHANDLSKTYHNAWEAAKNLQGQTTPR